MNEGRGSNRKGTLYRRWKGEKDYDLDNLKTKTGVIWLRYMVAGKIIEQSLKTKDADEAIRKQASIMRPLELATAKEVLLQTEVRLKQVENEQQEDWKKKNPPLKLDDAWEAYLKSQNRPRSGEATLIGYAAKYKKFRKWVKLAFPDAVYMKDVRTPAAEAYAEHLTSRKLSPSSYNQHLNALALIWSVLFKKSQTEENPFAWDKNTRTGIQRRSIQSEAHQRKKRPLTVEEIDEILKMAEGDYRTLIMILVCTGQRRVDGVKLEWRSIDLDHNILTLVPQKTSKRTGKAVHIPLFPQLKQELLLRNRKGRYVMPKLVEQYEKDSTVISKEIKKIFDKAKIETTKVTDITKAKKIPDVGAHSLRHTFVTIARYAGFPDPLIQQITGHSSMDMVDHYTQFSEKMVAGLAGRLLGTTATAKALPAPFSETTKEKLPGWARKQLAEIVRLAKQIKGKENAKLKAKQIALLDILLQ
jgi:integrase